MNKNGFAPLIVLVLIGTLIVAGGIYIFEKKNGNAPDLDKQKGEITTGWKTYTNTDQGYSFEYPEKLSLTASDGIVSLSHSIPFENRDGGCDMKGDSVLSKTLTDFSLSVNVVYGDATPSYVQGNYSKGLLNGKWVYMGAEGCGQTSYYFPITANRTLIVSKSEVQILSNVATSEVRAKVLAVPGVISQEEGRALVDRILSTFKFVEPGGNSKSEGKIIANLIMGWQSIQAEIPFRPTHPGVTAWLSPDSVQFIGNNSILIRFEDGYNSGMAILNFAAGFEVIKVFENQGNFSLSAWQNLVKEYGSSSYPVSTYTTNLVRNKQIISFENLTKVPENIFIKDY